MSDLTAYLEKYVLLSLEKQDKLAHLIGEYTYELNLDDGKIRFEDFEFPFQVLGTESENTFTWLWAWADEQTEIPENLTSASRELRDWGTREGIQEFVVPSIDLNRADGYIFSAIASEVCRASCYYRDAYEGGALFLLINDNRIDGQPSFDLRGLSRHLSYLISRYELNHRNALLSYCILKGLSPIEEGLSMTCILETGEQLSAEFDIKGRLMLLSGEPIDL